MNFDQFGPSQEKCTRLVFSLRLSQTSWIKSTLHMYCCETRIETPPEDQSNSSEMRLYRVSGQIVWVRGRDFLVTIHHGGYKCLLHYCQPRGRGFKQKFYHKFGPTVKGFSRALKIEKYKSPAIPRPQGAGDTNDFCMIIGI